MRYKQILIQGGHCQCNFNFSFNTANTAKINQQMSSTHKSYESTVRFLYSSNVLKLLYIQYLHYFCPQGQGTILLWFYELPITYVRTLWWLPLTSSIGGRSFDSVSNQHMQRALDTVPFLANGILLYGQRVDRQNRQIHWYTDRQRIDADN